MSLNAGFIVEVGPSYRIDWQNQESHINDSPIPVPAFHDLDKYNNISIWEIDGRIATDYCTRFYLGAEGKYGWVTSGNGQNRGLFFNGPAEFFDTKRTEVTGHTLDAQLFLGYRFHFMCNRFAIVPVGGYEHHTKRFTQNNGEFNYNDVLNIVDLTNNFVHKDHIRGPFTGLDFEWGQCKNFSLFGAFHWNWYLYTALSSISFDDIDTPTAFVENNFKSSVDAHITGPSFFLGATYNLNKNAYLCLKTSYYYTYLMSGTKRNTLFTESISSDSVTNQNLYETPASIE